MPDSLPIQMLAGAKLSGQEYGWSLEAFLSACALAGRFGLACLGGQIQFRFEDGVFEAYWLSADSSERTIEESWSEYVRRSCDEVASKFRDLTATLNVEEVVEQWPGLRARLSAVSDAHEALLFIAYFVTEAEYQAL